MKEESIIYQVYLRFFGLDNCLFKLQIYGNNIGLWFLVGRFGEICYKVEINYCICFLV